MAGRSLPEAGAPASRTAHFFATLTSGQRRALADRHPSVVGSLNGGPVTVRYHANRLALKRAAAVEKRRTGDERLTAGGRSEAVRRMHRFRSMLAKDRQILAFDPSGRGRAAEVSGDLDRAARVSVVVPGVDTDLLTLERSHRVNSAPVGMAKSLYGAERAAAPATRTAVIAWADYTAPAGLGMDAALGGLAAEGALRLNALLGALPGASTVSLFCHSYGSVVCGMAAGHAPGRVADIAVAKSPGMRAESAARLGTDARIWAMRDRDDWIGDVPHLEFGGIGHGADPVDPAFGARFVSAAGATGHSGCFEPGTESLGNFAAIDVGAYGSVRCATDGDACHRGISGDRDG